MLPLAIVVTNPWQGVLYCNYGENGWSEKHHLRATSLASVEADLLEIATARSYLLAKGATLEFAVVRQCKRPCPLKPVLQTPLHALTRLDDSDYWLGPNDVFSGPWIWGETADGRSAKKLLHCLADDEITAGRWTRAPLVVGAGSAVAPADPRTASKAELFDYYFRTLRDRTVHARKIAQDDAGNTTWEQTPWSTFYHTTIGKADIGRRWARVSWEPGDYDVAPTFSPCGTCVMVVRSCYAAPCKFYSNGVENELSYYFVDDSAALLPHLNIFHPAVQIQPYTRGTGPGEKSPFSRSWWTAGYSAGNAPGTAPTGTAGDFLGLTAASYNQSLPTPEILKPGCDLPGPLLTVDNFPLTFTVSSVNRLTVDDDTLEVSTLGTRWVKIKARPALKLTLEGGTPSYAHIAETILQKRDFELSQPLAGKAAVKLREEFPAPLVLTGTVNDWAIDADAKIIPVTVTGDAVITGIAGGRPGRRITLVNVGAVPLRLQSEAGGSVITNLLRFGNAEWPLLPWSAVDLVYGDSRWRAFTAPLVHANRAGATRGYCLMQPESIDDWNLTKSWVRNVENFVELEKPMVGGWGFPAFIGSNTLDVGSVTHGGIAVPTADEVVELITPIPTYTIARRYFLLNNSAFTITFRNRVFVTGGDIGKNIACPGNVDYDLGPYDAAEFMWMNAAWVILERSDTPLGATAISQVLALL